MDESAPGPTLVALCLFSVCAALSGPVATATTEPFSPPPFGHYQPILDRMPFGSLPANFGQAPVDPAAAQTAAQLQAEQQKLAKQITMSAVNITPDGQTAIGFTDLSAKPPINYFLLVGASANGWKVVSADYDDEIATLEKDNVTITLQLGKGLVDPTTLPGKPGEPAAVRPLNVPNVPATLVTRPGGPPAAGSSLRGGLSFPTGRAGLTRNNMPIGMPSNAAMSIAPPTADENGEIRSYKERLLERKTQQSEAQVADAKRQQELLVKLAREAAQKEIARREEEAAQAAVEEPAMEAQPQEAPQQEGTVE